MDARTKIGGLFTQAEHREQHAAFNSLLARLDETIDWEFFRSEVELAANYSGKGRRAHDAVLMLKILVLQRYYDLSEEQTGFQILDRFSFQKFLGFESGGRVRARVEHPFAFVKMMGGDWLRTIGEERAARGVGLTNFTYKLLRFGQLGHAM